jgi:HD-GYP domain-containing protein (c-di-GMP phosphodiesterase class II)
MHIYETLKIVTQALSSALKHRDLHTQLHSNRVIEIAAGIGERCGLTRDELALLEICASLHDIGKIGIHESILSKPGPFDDKEWAEMKTHAEIGADIVSNLEIAGSEVIAHTIRHHHENFDGNGYPDGLAGEDIPHLSRIITIADCFDAMTEPRPYHGARTGQQALNKMLSDNNTGKFDPYILPHFEKLIRDNVI